MGIACAEPPAYQDCMSPSQIPDSIFKQLTILVVAANAGIYTPRRWFWEKLFAGFRATTQACGDVSRRSPGRRRGRIFKMHVRILATRCARGLRELSRLEIRGRRECRVHAAPAVSRAIVQKKRTRAYRFSGGNPTFPAQWFYGLYRALPGDRACLTPPANMVLFARSGSQNLRKLDANR